MAVLATEINVPINITVEEQNTKNNQNRKNCCKRNSPRKHPTINCRQLNNQTNRHRSRPKKQHLNRHRTKNPKNLRRPRYRCRPKTL